MASQVVSAADAQKAYQQNLQAAAGKWAQRIQQYQGTPPGELAVKHAVDAKNNYLRAIDDTGPNGWAAKLIASGIQGWKAGAAQGQAKYAMAKGAAKWGKWYSTEGQQIAMAMKSSAQQGKDSGVKGIQRCMDALTVAESMGRKGMG